MGHVKDLERAERPLLWCPYCRKETKQRKLSEVIDKDERTVEWLCLTCGKKIKEYRFF